jgi:hypothetical protein
VDISIVRKPMLGKAKCERLKISLGLLQPDGTPHTKIRTYSLDEICDMALRSIGFLQEHGFTHAQGCDFYMQLVDAQNYAVSHFPNGAAIADHTIIVPQPYACAADHYDKKFHLFPGLRPW